ncbi:MAG TPA: trehalose-phosphatase [Actinomycetota bacterium]|nr:trehalose-phosphatase [Actinomycetota bacterium]
MSPEDVVRLLTADPRSNGVFTDFDGTLAPIVDHPDDAAALPGAVEVLEALAERFGRVGVISGRSLGDVRSRLDPRGVVLAGSYGRQRSDRATPPSGADWTGVADEAEIAVAGIGGVYVERKEHGVAVHYRLAPDAEPQVRTAAEELARTHGLQVRAGRLVQELTEPGPGKGDALAELADGLDAFLFAGDDVADVEAFRRARTLPARAVCVAVVSDESPPDLRDEADLCLDSQEELLDLFGALSRATAPRSG